MPWVNLFRFGDNPVSPQDPFLLSYGLEIEVVQLSDLPRAAKVVKHGFEPR